MNVTCPNPACVFPGNPPRRVSLEPIERNFHGAGVDWMRCRRCGREYIVSYKVDVVMRIDPETMEAVP